MSTPDALPSAAEGPPLDLDLSGRMVGRYRLDALVGQGGMATVYRALQPGPDREVAVKVLRMDPDAPQDRVARFQREVRILSALDHPHIVPLFDSGQEGTYLFLVMPLMRWGTLADRFRPGVPETASRIRRIGKQIAGALDYAHSKGIVHRDLKPTNILVDEHGHHRVSDFGIARLLDPATGETSILGGVLGSPRYMAPEQAAAEPVGPRADLYSLGVILHELATGVLRPPPVREGVWPELTSIGLANPDVPDDLVRTIERATSHDPGERFASAAEMALALGGESEEGTERRGPSGDTAAWPATETFVQPTELFQPAVQPGDLLADRFELVDLIGRGASGLVFRARDRERDTEVAVKTLSVMDPDRVYRLKREFRAIGDLRHPNLISLGELVADGDRWFFTMELVEGVPFDLFVRPVGDPGPVAEGRTRCSVDEPKLRASLEQLAEGVQALHESGRVHRDLKPSNVLVSADGRVVLLDLGLVASTLESPLETGTRHGSVGTPRYMPPERERTAASDWYSIGVMLFEALTGQPPFHGTASELEQAKTTGPAPSVHHLVDGAPADLAALAAALLERDPDRRATGGDLLDVVRGRGFRLATSATPSPLPSSTFVGRDRELDVLATALERVRAGRFAGVFVHGPSGIGKTALVERFVAGLEDDDAVVLAGRCYADELVPYKAFDSLVDSLSHFIRGLPPLQVARLLPRWTAALTRLFPVLERSLASGAELERRAAIGDPHEVRRRGFEAVRELLLRLTDAWPVVLVIEDLQWGDLDSATLLAEILAPPNPPPCLLIATYRSEDRDTSPFLVELDRLGRTGSIPTTTEIPLDVLSPAEASRLTAEILERPEPGLAERLARESGGSPFLVGELARWHEAAGPDATEPSDRDSALDRVVVDRVRQIGDADRRVLEVLSIAGVPVPDEIAARAAGVEDAHPNLARLASLRMARRSSTREGLRYEPHHDRIRRAVVGALPTDRVRSCHLRIAHAFEDHGQDDPEVLATHLAAGGEVQRASRFASVAADRALAALAFDRAADLYRRALEWSGREGDEAERWLRGRADALAGCGRGRQSAETYLELARRADGEGATRWLRAAAEQHLRSGHIEDGLRGLADVFTHLGMRFPSTRAGVFVSLAVGRVALATTLHRTLPARTASGLEADRIDCCSEAAAGVLILDPVRGLDLQTRHLRLAHRSGDRERLSRALSFEGYFSSMDGGPARARTEALFERAHSLAEEAASPYLLALVEGFRGAAAMNLGEWRQARELSLGAQDKLRESGTGVPYEIVGTQVPLLASHTYMSELRELRVRVPPLQREAQERGDLYGSTLFSLFEAYGHMASDDVDAARATIDEALGRWTPEGYHLPHCMALAVSTYLDLYAGEGDRALERLDGQWPRLRRGLFLRCQYFRTDLLSLYARGHLAVAATGRDRRRHRAAARRFARRIHRETMPWATPMARVVDATLEHVAGRDDRARSLLARAVEEFEAVEMGGHASVTRYRLGCLTGGDEGAELVELARAFPRSQDVPNHDAMAGMLAPGLPGADGA